MLVGDQGPLSGVGQRVDDRKRPSTTHCTRDTSSGHRGPGDKRTDTRTIVTDVERLGGVRMDPSPLGVPV